MLNILHHSIESILTQFNTLRNKNNPNSKSESGSSYQEGVFGASSEFSNEICDDIDEKINFQLPQWVANIQNDAL